MHNANDFLCLQTPIWYRSFGYTQLTTLRSFTSKNQKGQNIEHAINIKIKQSPLFREFYLVPLSHNMEKTASRADSCRQRTRSSHCITIGLLHEYLSIASSHHFATLCLENPMQNRQKVKQRAHYASFYFACKLFLNLHQKHEHKVGSKFQVST